MLGKSVRVVETDLLAIDELSGNVSTKDDRLSIAYVTAKAGAKEPWLTVHYDEYICVRKGHIILSQEGKPDVTVETGQTFHIAPDTRFRPSFPVDVEYIPVCLPAFRPDRCIREDENEVGEKVAENLKALHADAEQSDVCAAGDVPEVMYHMTSVAEWAAAKAEGVYYPKTFVKDGHYTHATGVPERLLETANHFYQDVEGDWVCVQFTRSALRNAGIFVRDEEAMPVGEKKTSDGWRNWICPHVIGGIPLHVVEKEYAMKRDGPKYVSIEGLC